MEISDANVGLHMYIDWVQETYLWSPLIDHTTVIPNTVNKTKPIRHDMIYTVNSSLVCVIGAYLRFYLFHANTDVHPLPQARYSSNRQSIRSIKNSCTVFIGAAERGLALGTGPDLSGGRHGDAVLGPLVQSPQHHLLVSGRDGVLLQELCGITVAV